MSRGTLPGCPGGRCLLFLVGFMGSGKSTLGRALGARPGWRYVDLDDLMEERQGMTVSGIFASRGEEWFRREESRLLREAASSAQPESGVVTVIGCGGGTPCHSGNMEWMNARGVTVLLEASEDVLLRRLLEARDQRPLLRGMDAARLREFIRSRQAARAPHYGKASLRLCSDLLESEEQIARTADDFLRLTGLD